MKSLLSNKRGNIFFGVVLGITLFVAGVLFIPFITDTITDTRTDLNCSSASTITGGTMLLCLLTDTVIPYFIVFFISISLGFIGGRS